MPIDSTPIPVFFIHRGEHDYLKHVMESCKKYNNNLIYVGDSPSYAAIADLHIEIDSLSGGGRFHEFLSIYEHLSFGSEEFELICFERFFLLQKAIKLLSIERFWMLDSDFLLLSNLEQVCDYIPKDVDSILSSPHDQADYFWASSPHCSFWTSCSLDDFINFIFSIYQFNIGLLREKFYYHKLHRLPGGVCDMTLLYLWSKDRVSSINSSFFFEKNGIDFFIDHQISSPWNYRRGDFFAFRKILKIKDIFLLNNKLYVKRISDSPVYLRIIGLHFQGGAKKFIKNIHRGVRNNSNFGLAFWVKLYCYTTVDRLFRKFFNLLS